MAPAIAEFPMMLMMVIVTPFTSAGRASGMMNKKQRPRHRGE
jgi:hypothetical protein